MTHENFEGLHSYVNNYLKSFIDNFTTRITDIKNEDFVVIYGCSIQVQSIYNKLNKKQNIVFCDRNYENIKTVSGISIISPEELIQKYKNVLILLCVGEANIEVLNFLIKNGIHKKDILEIGVTDSDAQYFDDVIKLTDNEIFVDAGCFDGGTSIKFAQKTNFTYDKIFAFEPDLRNQKTIKDNIEFKSLNNIKLFNLGLWDKKEILELNSRFASSNITDSGDIEINCDTLDDILESEPVSFIKMDIEGAELNALKGAQNIIKKYKPKLAISVYHKPEDIIDIPIYIKSLVPEYKFYIRHYSTTYTETVLYAVMK